MPLVRRHLAEFVLAGRKPWDTDRLIADALPRVHVDALVSAGRPTKYDGVSVDLNTLVQAGRVKRMGRGVYSMP